MKPFDGIALAFWSGTPTHEIVRYAKLAEKSGICDFWVAEIYHSRSVIPIATSILNETSRMTVGLGIVPTHSRHPALLAMEAVTLDELSGGRFILGLGLARTTAVKHHVKARPTALLKESVEVIRSVLSGEMVTYRGEVFNVSDSKLGFEPLRRNIPIYVGTYTTSSKTLELSGELADGVILIWLGTPERVRNAVKHIETGAKKRGRDPSKIAVAGMMMFSVDDDAEKAEDACRELIAAYIPRVHQHWVSSGLLEERDVLPVKQAYESEGLKAASRMVGHQIIQKLAIAGTPEDCIRRLEEFQGSGLKMPMAFQILGPDREKAISFIGSELIPTLTASKRG